MSRTSLSRTSLLAIGILAIFPCAISAQENAPEDSKSSDSLPSVSVLHVPSESLLRADFPGPRSWGHIEKGAVLEGRLSLPLYAGDDIAAPADSNIRVTVESVERIPENSGFWRKTGRAIVRA